MKPALRNLKIFDRAVDVVIPHFVASADWHAFFGSLRHVEIIDIRSDHMDDESLVGIEGWRDLVAIGISGKRITNKSLQRLSSCQNLRQITLESMDLDRASLELISGLPKMKVVQLLDCRFRDPQDLLLLAYNDEIIHIDVRWAMIESSIIETLYKLRPDIEISW